MANIDLVSKIKLKIVNLYVNSLNFVLFLLERTIFSFKNKKYNNILIYKVGNIGDTICAMPSLLAIRKHYPTAYITFLTSPGNYGASGAKEIFEGTALFDEMQIYYSGDIDTKVKKKEFAKKLKNKKYDLFIQLPEDLVSFRTMLRNILFAKLIGVKSAIGFQVNTTQIFKKAQVDNLTASQETERLLTLLQKYGITPDKIEFPFPSSVEIKNKVQNILNTKLRALNYAPLIALNPGGKRSTNCWPIDRYRELAENLHKKYNANIMILGSSSEKEKGNEIIVNISKACAINLCGDLTILETAELLRSASMLVSNSTGTMHLGASVGASCVGLYSIRDIPGKWSPYGDKHKIICHSNLSCDYKSEECIKESINSIEVDEVYKQCESVLNER